MKYRMEKVRLDQGGYYNFGKCSTYYGRGAPLYRVEPDWEHDNFGHVRFVRGSTREAAKKEFRRYYDPNARFYR